MLPCSGRGQAPHVRMVSSTGSVESAWLASFFRDLRLHSFSTSKLATSRILQRDCGKMAMRRPSQKIGLQISPVKGKAEVNLRTRTTKGNLAKLGNQTGPGKAKKTTHHAFHVVRQSVVVSVLSALTVAWGQGLSEQSSGLHRTA